MANKTAAAEEYYKVITDTSGDVAEILLYGYIGQKDYWGDNTEEDITDVAFAKTLRELEKNNSRINVRINSPGGSMYHGNAIITAIQNSKSEIHTYNDGLAASMGADIWLCAKNRHMAENSLLMLHGPAGICMGTAKQMRNEADVLDKFEDTIVNMMIEATDMTEEEIRNDFYDGDDHWLNVQDCKKYGFITEKEETYQAESNLPTDIQKMSYADIVNHFETKNDNESKGLLTRLAEKWQSTFTNRVKSAPTVTKNNKKMETPNKEETAVAAAPTHADLQKQLEEAGYTVTAPVAEKTTEEQITEAVTKAMSERDAQIADMTAKIEKLAKSPAGEPTIVSKQKSIDPRDAGLTDDVIKMRNALEAEAIAEAAGY